VSSDTLLALEHVSKQFNGLTVVNDVSFSVRSGEILGLVGPNGSGKTTAINLISGIYQLDAGHIQFEARIIDRVPTFRRVPLGINRTFQVPKPFREMTAYENVQVALHFGAHVARADEDAAVRAVLAEVALEDHAQSLASDLTVNQQKRLDLGRALATNPKLLLVDEIGAGLNPQELAIIADLLLRLAARGIALIVVEHLLDFLNRITNRVIVLSAGCVSFEGTLADASRNPAVVAAFIGG
jgi:branched-chain amino acid transport system ATP-binding protein